MNPAVELINVCMTFQNREILQHINLVIPEGQRMALTGPSGAGKSTILKIIAGLITPTSGRIIRHSRKIGYVFQEPRLLPWETALKNVIFPLLARGERQHHASEAGRECLAKMGLSGFEQHYPDQLSGGMKQRVSIARALVIEPDLLLLDEPFTGLDPNLRDSICHHMESALSQKTTTLIHVTHDAEGMIHTADTLYTLTAPDTLHALPRRIPSAAPEGVTATGPTALPRPG
ncbi:ATP-binding cassette domain-containing protein [Desulfobotulus sp. H1]|uniref:ATP-binding cassette domain-containing protein n=1 Tax=Desulfobotulus pelophilus TaxID=2823377 RepID=A0ABT3N917_9BACT|nr:ATP-binding cassette domain-containing protein [Desulfobotulus pelophilus]MCW7753512.1 ATP-binding cassette domain-containing protein [Desulfobotulus pelophilus]